ncbi:hypothetical protein ISN45_Aa02g010790, partial [Arabidopsis thaliana x Arabidopsis arenosa]
STNPHRIHLLEIIFLQRNTRDGSAVSTTDRSKSSLIGNINGKPFKPRARLSPSCFHK